MALVLALVVCAGLDPFVVVLDGVRHAGVHVSSCLAVVLAFILPSCGCWCWRPSCRRAGVHASVRLAVVLVLVQASILLRWCSSWSWPVRHCT